jgi:formate dehydrogenase assembly factor FdhD
VHLADRLGMTLVGFLRGDGFNVYSHDNRIDLRDLLG